MSSVFRANGKSDAALEAKFATIDAKMKMRAIIEALPSDRSPTHFMTAVVVVRKINNNLDSIDETLTLSSKLQERGYVGYSSGESEWRNRGGVSTPDMIWLTSSGAEMKTHASEMLGLRNEQKAQTPQA